MNMRRNYILLTWLVVTVFCGISTSTAEEPTALVAQGDLYEKAISLKEDGKSDEAINMFKKFMDASKDELKRTDAMLEQCMIMKNMKNPMWKSKAKEAQRKVKILYKTHYMKPEYWLVYAKFAAIVNEERDVYGAFKKAFFYKPDYPEGYCVKGDIYSYLAKNTDPSESTVSTAIGYEEAHVSKENSVRYQKGKEAKESYEIALRDSILDNDKKAYIHYKIGELEINILSDKEAAVKNWKKAVELAPESMYGKKSAEFLGKNQ
ncbi:MAG: hypothetical protein NG747_01430 [Candidatus Brocadia sp.]|nr:hypothetical protein [Candidatus Brocadia sp.]